MHTIELENYNKTIKGEQVLNNINLKLQSGKIYGVVGENGSGKSMLFRAISGLINLDSGITKCDGKIVPGRLNQVIDIGLVLENINLYMDMTAVENLCYLAKIRGKITKQDVIRVLERVGLDSKSNKKIKTYSLGMRQKLIIAQAIMEKQDLILLDEPSNALDEKSVEVFHNIVKEEAKRGAIVVIASHNKSDISGICDQVYTMASGVLKHAEG